MWMAATAGECYEQDCAGDQVNKIIKKVNTKDEKSMRNQAQS
jgi:hypothetical protein